jgi:hypothetical protein
MKNHNLFVEKLFTIESEEERYRLLKEYMLSLNLEELMAWTKSDFAQLHASLDKGISDAEREKLTAQLSKFDKFQSINMQTRKAA